MQYEEPGIRWSEAIRAVTILRGGESQIYATHNKKGETTEVWWAPLSEQALA